MRAGAGCRRLPEISPALCGHRDPRKWGMDGTLCGCNRPANEVKSLNLVAVFSLEPGVKTAVRSGRCRGMRRP